MLVVEIIEHCNFKCYFCSAQYVEKPLYMDLALFKKIITQASEMGLTHLDLTPSKGEPFLHPDIYEMLAFADSHMSYVSMLSNASAINVDKLKALNLKHLKLSISYYGATPEKFNELTRMDESLYKIVHKRLKQMDEADVQYNLERRDINYTFTYTGVPSDVPFDLKVKCHFHSMPKIHVNGGVTFCKFARSNIPDNEDIFFANVNDVDLKTALESPIRYKFFDSQSICANRCNTFDKKMYKESIPSFKVMLSSKKNYLANKEAVDKQYKNLEDATIQPFKQSS